jgi:hypothetical protein
MELIDTRSVTTMVQDRRARLRVQFSTRTQVAAWALREGLADAGV